MESAVRVLVAGPESSAPRAKGLLLEALDKCRDAVIADSCLRNIKEC
jgi:hypothetical protein